MKSREITLRCENCCFNGRPEADDAFDVSVPLTDGVSGERYVARLRCRISAEEHRVSLEQLRNDQGEVVSLDAETSGRLDALLDRVSEKRICGNADICPSAVVDIVQGSMREQMNQRSSPGTRREGGSSC